MECAHRQLRAWLADRLSRDNTDGFTLIDGAATSEVAAVALAADAKARVASQCGADLDLVHTSSLEHVEHVFVHHLACAKQQRLVFRVVDLDGGDATQHSIAQALDDLAAFNQGAHVHAVVRSAVVFDDHQILGDIDQTSRQVARVCRLQRRVCQALASTVGGDEVLQNVQTLAEVCGDRRLDDRAIRLGHQTTHAGELTNLRRRATSARVRHHVDGVEGLLIDLVAVAINRLLLRELTHHDLADFVAGLAPDVDHLVVAFTGSYQAGNVLLLDFFDLFLGTLDQARLFLRHQHVVDADRDAGTRCQAEACLQQLVGKHHGFLQSALAE